MHYYTLLDNKFTQENKVDCFAKSVNSVIKNENDVFSALTVPGSILKEVEVRGVKSEIWKTIISYLENGYSYHDEYISIRLNIGGVFEDKNDRFDPKRHEIKISIVPGKKLKNAIRDLKPEFVKPTSVLPEIENIYDWGSDTNNEILTPGGSLEIIGDELKIYDSEGQGVFFINKANGLETVADMPRINEPKQLSIRVPELEAGTYRIEVRNSTRRTKNLRIGTKHTEYTVK